MRAASHWYQSNFEQFRGIILPYFKIYHKATVTKNSIGTVLKQIYRAMEQIKETRKKHTCKWSPDFWQRWEEYTMGEE